jgi:hypothetical protein
MPRVASQMRNDADMQGKKIWWVILVRCIIRCLQVVESLITVEAQITKKSFENRASACYKKEKRGQGFFVLSILVQEVSSRR